MPDTLSFYREHSPFTDPGEYAYLYDAIPDDVDSMAQAVQGLVYHYFAGQWTFGYQVPPERQPEIDLRYAQRMLARLMELDDAPLTKPREHANKIVGCCRDFATLFCSIARHKGIPCRVRYGFGAYFGDFYGDHVIADYWNGERWVLVDAQMGPEMVQNLHLAFDVMDVPRDQFIIGGDAWQMIRHENADPDQFCVSPDIEQPRGAHYVMSHVLQDLAGLNKAECLCWDSWGLSETIAEDALMTDKATVALIDEVAQLTRENDPDLAALQCLYAEQAFTFNGTVISYSPAEQNPLEVALNL